LWEQVGCRVVSPRDEGVAVVTLEESIDMDRPVDMSRDDLRTSWLRRALGRDAAPDTGSARYLRDDVLLDGEWERLTSRTRQ